MPKPGFKYEVKSDQFFNGWAVENPKHHLNTGIMLRTATCMGIADFFCMIGEDKYPKLDTDTSQSYKSIPSWRFKDFQDFYDHRPENCDIVGVELTDDAVPLEEFKFTPRMIFLFGGEEVGLSKQAVKSSRYIVKLPSFSGVSMNLSSSAAMLMWERWKWLKNNGYNL